MKFGIDKNLLKVEIRKRITSIYSKEKILGLLALLDINQFKTLRTIDSPDKKL